MCGNLHFVKMRVNTFEKQAMPKTAEKLIKKLASNKINGETVTMAVKASDKLFKISDRCPLIKVKRQTELIITARKTDGENPTNNVYENSKSVIIGTLILALTRFIRNEMSATMNPT